jgi:DNA modification methylase
VTVDKCPQGLAIRNKSRSLLFAQMDRDRSWLSPAIPDTLLVFRKPGENKVPIRDDSLTREDWIRWARPVWAMDEDRAGAPFVSAWYDIRETQTLNVREARDNSDERHICPTPLPTLERCIRLWSNKGETVLSPFGGLGSEVVAALSLERRGIAVELKESYYRTMVRNVQDAAAAAATGTLFDLAEVRG